MNIENQIAACVRRAHGIASEIQWFLFHFSSTEICQELPLVAQDQNLQFSTTSVSPFASQFHMSVIASTHLEGVEALVEPHGAPKPSKFLILYPAKGTAVDHDLMLEKKRFCGTFDEITTTKYTSTYIYIYVYVYMISMPSLFLT